MRHRHAYRHTLRETAQHAARRRSVDVDCLANTDVNRGDHKRLPVDDKTEMTDQSFIKDLVHDRGRKHRAPVAV